MSITTHTPTTKREVLIAREAYSLGAWTAHHHQRDTRRSGCNQGFYDAPSPGEAYLNSARLGETIREQFPIPKVKRPRVVTDRDGDEWTLHPLHGLQVRYATGSGAWCDPRSTDFLGYEPTVAELLANPTEEVEDTE